MMGFTGEVLVLLLIAASLLFWLWMLIDVIVRRFPTRGEKAAWLAVVILLQFFGALVYFTTGRSARRAGGAISPPRS